jgi:hypothetical protein
MAIWPFKSKPVVLPFSNDYSAPVVQLFPLTPGQFGIFSVPDNQYIIPLVIRVPIALTAAAHGTSGPHLYFSRAGNIFASAGICLTAASFVGSLTYSATSLISAVTVYPRNITLPLPPSLHLYPRDVITFDLTNYVALDTIGPAYIHCKLSEVY